MVAKYVHTCITFSQEQVSGQLPHCSPLNVKYKRLMMDLDQCVEREIVFGSGCASKHGSNALYQRV